MVDLPHDLAHEHLLSEKPDDQGTYADEGFSEASDVSEEGQAVVDLALILVKHPVTAEVHCHNVTIFIRVDVIVLPDVDHLEVLVLHLLTQLNQVVLQLVLLPLDEKVCPPTYSGIQVQEQLVVDKGGDCFLEVLEVEHLVNESEGKSLIPEVAINSLLVLTSHSHWQVSRLVITLPQLQLEVCHFLLVEVSIELIGFVGHAV